MQSTAVMITDTNMTKPITDLEGRLDAAFKRSEAAALLGSLGGKASSKKLTPKQRKERATNAVRAREAKRGVVIIVGAI